MLVQGGYVSGGGAQQLIVKRSNALDKRAPRAGRSPTPQAPATNNDSPADTPAATPTPTSGLTVPELRFLVFFIVP